jgi:hypothetical protein
MLDVVDQIRSKTQSVYHS